jgi:hypothetical protein
MRLRRRPLGGSAMHDVTAFALAGMVVVMLVLVVPCIVPALIPLFGFVAARRLMS